MELLIIAAVVFVIFNIISSLGKQDKKRQPVPPGRAKPALDDESIPVEYHFRKHQDRRGRFAEPDLPRESLQQETAVKEEVAETAPRAWSQASAPAPEVMQGLTNILQDREQLVAAFIFHEIMAPPRSKRTHKQ